MQLSPQQQAKINSLVYLKFTSEAPSRHELIQYSIWRAYLYNELESVNQDQRDPKKNKKTYEQQFPHLMYSEDRREFYGFAYKPIEYSLDKYREQYRNDNISHFICRMLYCQEDTTQGTFIQMEKRILENRLYLILNDRDEKYRRNLMSILKLILTSLKEKAHVQVYDISNEQWNRFKDSIVFNVQSIDKKKQQYAALYAKLPFYEAEAGIRRRKSFVHRGYVYVNTEAMIDIVLSNYEQFLKKKLEHTKPIVQDLIIEDTENQFASFFITALKQINEEGIEDTKLNGKYNLTLKNIDALSGKYFPPCMLHLNQQLKINRHLRHDGRRQLWGFFKACGMDVQDNKEYFRKYLEGKVTASQMKTHLYNIEHAYGLQGKKKEEGAWKCRNIITAPAPKKGDHHGCPFAHWRSEELGDFIRKNYKVTEQNLKQILAQKQQKHFQVACGRLFEYSEVNKDGSAIPPEITAKLAKAPYLYYEAGMELREKKLKQSEGTMKPEHASIEF